MDREILFRAWNGRAMEYAGFSVHATGKILPMPALTNVKKNSPLMQYTGLKDCEGKKMFEGDVVASTTPSARFKGVIRFKNGGFEAYNKAKGRFCFNYDNYRDNLKIIGNIHDNPELLNDSLRPAKA